MVCLCLMQFDYFYGLLSNNVSRTFSNIQDGDFYENSYLQWDSLIDLDIGKGCEYTSAECKVNCLVMFCYIYILQDISCLKSDVYFVISVQLDFHLKHLRLSQTIVFGPVYAVIFREMNILRTLKQLAAATKRFSGKQKFVKFRKLLYR